MNLRLDSAIFLLFAVSSVLAAGKNPDGGRTVGGVLAYNEFTFSFQQYVSQDNFELNVNLDMADVISGRECYPGFSIDGCYNFTFAAATFGNGEKIRGYAGPGVSLGYVRDIDGKHCLIAGMCGNIGVEYLFNVPVSLSLSLNPTLSMAVKRNENGFLTMGAYKNGLIYSILPHIGIRYHF